MARRNRHPQDLQEAMTEANREHLRLTQRARVRTRVSQLILVLLLLAAVMFVVLAVRSGTSDNSAPSPARTSTTTPAMFDFSDAVPVCLERDGDSIEGHVPATFGRVERIALVGRDLEATWWEVLATPAVKLTSFEIGVTPPGFSSEHALRGEMGADGIVVVNGSTNLGLVAFDRGKIGGPGSCT